MNSTNNQRYVSALYYGHLEIDNVKKRRKKKMEKKERGTVKRGKRNKVIE